MARKPKKKGEAGAATAFISRKQALKKLQLSLKDFRRLCILKGIYPVEPRHRKKVNKGSSELKTFYYLKDIQFLSHEPLISKFRDFKIFARRLKKAVTKRDHDQAKIIRENRPTYKLDHIVKERYPTFVDAIRDLDDVLCMCFLFATFPKGRSISVDLVHLCQRLTVEFMHYVIEAKALRKVFVSIKGYYYQAEIMNETVTWVVPHKFGFQQPTDVDFKIMVTFTEFYSTMLGFVNYKLYTSANLYYPPKLGINGVFDNIKDMEDKEDLTSEYISALNMPLRTKMPENAEEEPQIDEFPMTEDHDKVEAMMKEEEAQQRQKTLFKGLKFFLNREVPRESLVFVIRAFGGVASWDKTLFVGATFDESDESITHQIVDRPSMSKQYLNRYYVQPQWVYDSVNARMLLPVEDYFLGVTLPPHLSPFVEEKPGEYVPPEKQRLIELQQGITIGRRQHDSESEEEISDEEDKELKETVQAPQPQKKRKLEDSSEAEPKEMAVKRGTEEIENKVRLAQREAAEEKRLAVMMIPKKKKRLFDKIMYGKRRKNREAEALRKKREEHDKNEKLKKRKRKQQKLEEIN